MTMPSHIKKMILKLKLGSVIETFPDMVYYNSKKMDYCVTTKNSIYCIVVGHDISSHKNTTHYLIKFLHPDYGYLWSHYDYISCVQE